MHHQRKPPTHIHWNILTWDCDVHGPHRVIVAGLDDTADLVATIMLNEQAGCQFLPRRDHSLIPLADARRATDEGIDWDDLPY